MTQSTAAESRPAGLGRYRFRETLSTSFFGPRYRVDYEGAPGHSDAPLGASASISPHADAPLALRLVEVDAPNLLERIARAVQAVREVDHRCVLRPVQIVRASTRLGIVTPNIEGATLAKLLQDASTRGESIPPSIALRIVSDILYGLQALSDQGPPGRRRDWGYGGVTPDSIHVGLDGQTRYLDPGVASAAARQPCWSHEASALAYTAPEQTGADANFDASSDNFSVGVILWEMLTCRPLFGADTAAETLERLHLAPIPRVQRPEFLRGEPIVSALAQAVSQALRRDPQQRFGSYDDFLNALDAAGEPAGRANVSEWVERTLSGAERHEPSALTSTTDLSVPFAETPILRSLPLQLTAAIESAPPPDPDDVEEHEPTSEHVRATNADRLWPANAAWIPEAAAPQTPFPVGDLEREPIATGHRNGWTWGLALAACVGLGVFGWQMSRVTLQRTAATVAPPPPMAAEPPAPIALPARSVPQTESKTAPP
ncbi:MAG TPA: protein kinase, partial [Polyangiales bacterium]|nr:protein kinase [Polyangiales bacterium]